MKVFVTGGAGHWFSRTGAGFGDYSIALVPAGVVNKLQPLSKNGFEEPAFYEFPLAAGAEVLR